MASILKPLALLALAEAGAGPMPGWQTNHVEVVETAGRQTDHVQVDGFKREYQYVIPTACTSTACPMLLFFHGQYGSIPGPRSGYDEYATSSGMIFVYLQGIDENNGRTSCGTAWNTLPDEDEDDTCTNPANLGGTVCSASCKTKSLCTDSHTGCRWATCTDDVAFTKAVIAALRTGAHATSDLHATGDSNGGMFVNHLLEEMPQGTFRTIVSWFGNPVRRTWKPSSGTSVLDMHGRNDQTIPATGEGPLGGWYYTSGVNCQSQLAGLNSCASKTSAFSMPYDNNQMECTQHASCGNGATVARCLYNGGHAFCNNAFEITLWFIENHAIPAATANATSVDALLV